MAQWFQNTLTGPEWALLGVIPPLIVLLYFLKLKRRPLEVPSTYLWRKALEDVHVNSLWQRLRQNLLLILQLLFIGLIALAALRPGWQGTKLTGQRWIFLVDNSASMSATDMKGSRLDAAKKQCAAMIDRLDSGAVAMVISFSDLAKVEQTFTDNRRLLKEKVAGIQPTQRRSDLEDALRAASGLANPGRSSNEKDVQDVQVAEAMPAELCVLSDGAFPTLPNFALGNLHPVYMPQGTPAAANVSISSFSTGRNPEQPTKLQAFARLENFSDEAKQVTASLYLNNQLLDSQQVKVPARDKQEPGRAGVQFELEQQDEGTLKLELDAKDDFALDNVAYTVLDVARPARVLVVSPSVSAALRLALSTDEAAKVSQITYESPTYLQSKEYATAAATGSFDLMIFERCVPPGPPQSSTLFIGRVPPFENWKPGKPQGQPANFDVNRTHPLTQLIDMANVLVADCTIAETPKMGEALIYSDVGPILTLAPRQSFEDAFLGFEITGENEQGAETVKTDWPRRRSFPVFFMNAIKYLGRVGGQSSLASVRPGDAYPLRPLVPVESIQVETPRGEKHKIPRDPRQSSIPITQTDEIGVYQVREGSGQAVTHRFAVNLFDSRESDLMPVEKLDIGHEEVAGAKQQSRSDTRHEYWKWIVALALGIMLVEWYVYNRRVYV